MIVLVEVQGPQSANHGQTWRLVDLEVRAACGHGHPVSISRTQCDLDQRPAGIPQPLAALDSLLTLTSYLLFMLTKFQLGEVANGRTDFHVIYRLTFCYAIALNVPSSVHPPYACTPPHQPHHPLHHYHGSLGSHHIHLPVSVKRPISISICISP